MLVDLGATTDLDVPSADMLNELYEELANQNVRLMLTRVITPVQSMLERAGVIYRIRQNNILNDPVDAVIHFLLSHDDPKSLRGLLHSGLLSIQPAVRARLSKAPFDHRAELFTLAEGIEQAILHIELEERD